MKATAQIHPASIAVLLGTVLAASALAGLGFAGWLDHGAQMFMTLAQAGMAWCF
jgi:CBS-domain-containing membrane protein